MNDSQAKVLWFTGLSGSGKSTIANLVKEQLLSEGKWAVLLDGDDLRRGLCSDLGFSEKDRTENVRRAAEVAKLFSSEGIITLCCFISPLQTQRNAAKEIIGSNFVECFVDTPFKICEERDPKGLYKKARKGEILEFTGVSSPYEIPRKPDIHLDTVKKTLEELSKICIKYLEI